MSCPGAWTNRVLFWTTIGLWWTGSVFLLAGYAKSIYRNLNTIPVYATVNGNYFENGNLWSRVALTYGNHSYSGMFSVGHFASYAAAKAYADKYWYVGSVHLCFLIDLTYLTLTLEVEYWPLVIAGILLCAALGIGIGALVREGLLQRKRKQDYRDLDEPQDFVLISTKDLDSDMRKGEYPSTCGRSAMDSFDEAQALFWIFLPALQKKYGEEKVANLKKFQIECLTGSAAARFQFQQDVDEMLTLLG